MWEHLILEKLSMHTNNACQKQCRIMLCVINNNSWESCYLEMLTVWSCWFLWHFVVKLSKPMFTVADNKKVGCFTDIARSWNVRHHSNCIGNWITRVGQKFIVQNTMLHKQWRWLLLGWWLEATNHRTQPHIIWWQFCCVWLLDIQKTQNLSGCCFSDISFIEIIKIGPIIPRFGICPGVHEWWIGTEFESDVTNSSVVFCETIHRWDCVRQQ